MSCSCTSQGSRLSGKDRRGGYIDADAAYTNSLWGVLRDQRSEALDTHGDKLEVT
jgi:hypothetical protein